MPGSWMIILGLVITTVPDCWAPTLTAWALAFGGIPPPPKAPGTGPPPPGGSTFGDKGQPQTEQKHASGRMIWAPQCPQVLTIDCPPLHSQSLRYGRLPLSHATHCAPRRFEDSCKLGAMVCQLIPTDANPKPLLEHVFALDDTIIYPDLASAQVI